MFHGLLGDSPCHTTIRTWLAKMGLDAIKHKDRTLDEAYAIIMDASISVGDQQMLLALKVPADHTGKALTHADEEVVGMAVSENWPAAKSAPSGYKPHVGSIPQTGVREGRGVCRLQEPRGQHQAPGTDKIRISYAAKAEEHGTFHEHVSDCRLGEEDFAELSEDEQGREVLFLFRTKECQPCGGT